MARLPAAEGLARLSPDRFRASSLASLVEETGIPRQTARAVSRSAPLNAKSDSVDGAMCSWNVS